MDLMILCSIFLLKKSRIRGYSSGLICIESLCVKKGKFVTQKEMISKLQNKAKHIQHWCDARLRLVWAGSSASICKAGICHWSFTGLVPASPVESGADVEWETRLGSFTVCYASVCLACTWSVGRRQPGVLTSLVTAAADLQHKHNCCADVISSWIAAHGN